MRGWLNMATFYIGKFLYEFPYTGYSSTFSLYMSWSIAYIQGVFMLYMRNY